MSKLAETIVRGSKNLDQMRADTKLIVDLICKGYEVLDFRDLHTKCFQSRGETETFWDFEAGDSLHIRCISDHPSVRVTMPAIIYTTSNAFWNEPVRRHYSGAHRYRVEFGMKGVQLAYDSLDILLEEVFTRWSTFRSYLQPLITAGEIR